MRRIWRRRSEIEERDAFKERNSRYQCKMAYEFCLWLKAGRLGRSMLRPYMIRIGDGVTDGG